MIESKNNEMNARYERARKLIQGIFTNKVALNTTLFPVWIGNSDYFWYEREIRKAGNPEEVGKQYRLVNAKAVSNTIAFDHESLAAALAEVSKEEVDADNLPIKKLELEIGQSTPSDGAVTDVRFSAFNKRWLFETATGACSEIESRPDNEVISPNGAYAIFERNYNLWLRGLKTGPEKALTTDGEEFYVYGAVGTAWGHPMPPVSLQVLWSSDSKRIFTIQRDTRRVKPLPVVHHVPRDGTIRPTVEYPRVAFPSDEHVEELRLLAIDVEAGKHQPACYCQIPVTRNSHGFFSAGLGWWATDNRRAYFVDVDRYYKYARVLEFDTGSGACRILFEETSDTQLNLQHSGDEPPTILPLPESDELIWFSQRSGWAHLYLYDLTTGELKNPITSGDWVVREIVRYDAGRRELFVQTAGRVEGRDPYYCELVRVNIDTGEMATLASSDHDYVALTDARLTMISMIAQLAAGKPALNSVSPSGEFATVTRSRADEVPVSLLIDRNGNEILKLETGDMSGLPEGWRWPEPVALKAADGKTDIYGLIYRPSDFSPDRSYPIVSHVFNTPDFPWTPKGSFTNDKWFGWPYLDAAALAELGFIVVQIDGRGASYRNRAFLDESYGNVECASMLQDQVVGIQQLAERYPYMNLDRVGCYATSGGPGPVQGLLQYPDFYKVGVSPCHHDSRITGATMWGDKYEGPSKSKTKSSVPPGEIHQFPEQYVEKLQGKLLLMAGMLDAPLPPAATFRLVEALQKANKDFDLIMLPNLGHEPSPYIVRRSWDYLVKHLMGVEPPKEFPMTGVYGAPAPETGSDATPAT